MVPPQWKLKDCELDSDLFERNVGITQPTQSVQKEKQVKCSQIFTNVHRAPFRGAPHLLQKCRIELRKIGRKFGQQTKASHQICIFQA